MRKSVGAMTGMNSKKQRMDIIQYIPYKSVQHNGEDEKGHLCASKYPMLELQGLNARSGEAAIYKSAKSAQMRKKIWRSWKGRRRRTKQYDELLLD